MSSIEYYDGLREVAACAGIKYEYDDVSALASRLLRTLHLVGSDGLTTVMTIDPFPSKARFGPVWVFKREIRFNLSPYLPPISSMFSYVEPGCCNGGGVTVPPVPTST